MQNQDKKVESHYKSSFTTETQITNQRHVFLLFCLQESENLEKENAALRKEVKQLTEEAKYLSSVLSSHELQCTSLAPQTSSDHLFPPHHSSYHHQHITVPHYQH